jgi:hypothetical protein
MRKAVLEGNILPKAKQRFLVDGYPSVDILNLTRDMVTSEIGVIELPDQTKVPGGRRRAGEFTMSIAFHQDSDRELFRDWHYKCVDDGGERGIDPTYKRNATAIYMRLFSGNPGTYNSGSQLQPVKVRIFGCWPSSFELGDYDMNSDEGDGFVTSQITIQYDLAELEKTNALSSF